jgi:hypothetical protein
MGVLLILGAAASVQTAEAKPRSSSRAETKQPAKPAAPNKVAPAARTTPTASAGSEIADALPTNTPGALDQHLGRDGER